MKIDKQYVVVDDDHLNNMLCSINIRKQDPNAPIFTFTDPDEALRFLTKIADDTIPLTIVFLDINMPAMTGWDFMEQFRLLDENMKSKFRVFILTSSVDKRDIERANSTGDVKGIISKPLKLESLLLE